MEKNATLRGSKHTLTPPTYFQGVRTPAAPSIYGWDSTRACPKFFTGAKTELPKIEDEGRKSRPKSESAWSYWGVLSPFSKSYGVWAAL